MAVGFAVVAVGAVAASSCVFELGDVVEPAAGGAGGEAPGGGGGAGAQGGQGGEGISMARRTRIELDTTALGAALADFPLLVQLTNSHVDYALAGTDGAAVRFYAEDGTTLLAHEIERWVVDATSHVWVRLPTVAPGGNVVLWMHVGESSPPAPLAPTSVWNAYESVYHFADPIPGPLVRDATANGRHGTPVGMDVTHVAESLFGAGYLFDGNDAASPHVDLGSDAAFRVPPGGVLTAEVWFRRSSASGDLGYVLGMEGCCLGWGMTVLGPPLQFRSVLGVDNCCTNADSYSYAQYNMPGGDGDVAWHHSVSVMDRGSDQHVSYLDGIERETQPVVSTAHDGQGALKLGANFSGLNGFDGYIDEFRLSTRAVPPAWIELEYETMTGSGVTIGSPEPLP